MFLNYWLEDDEDLIPWGTRRKRQGNLYIYIPTPPTTQLLKVGMLFILPLIIRKLYSHIDRGMAFEIFFLQEIIKKNQFKTFTKWYNIKANIDKIIIFVDFLSIGKFQSVLKSSKKGIYYPIMWK
jgi:hypothetical protein